MNNCQWRNVGPSWKKIPGNIGEDWERAWKKRKKTEMGTEADFPYVLVCNHWLLLTFAQYFHIFLGMSNITMNFKEGTRREEVREEVPVGKQHFSVSSLTGASSSSLQFPQPCFINPLGKKIGPWLSLNIISSYSVSLTVTHPPHLLYPKKA